MAGDRKIAALLRSIDLDEQKIVAHRQSVQKITDERRQQYEALQAKEAHLKMRLAQGGAMLRDSSVQHGEVGQLAEWERFSKRLQKELEVLAPQLVESLKELQSAEQRLAVVDEELLEVRIERKRIERIMENRETQERLQNQALDEASSDDLSVFKNRE